MTITPPPDPSRHGHRNALTGDAGAVVQAGTVHGGIHLTGTDGYAAVPVPLQLRAAPACWADRAAELAVLNRLAPPAVRPRVPSSGTGDGDGNDHGTGGERAALVVIAGQGGVGKTALALRWLHQHRARFRDGHLFADLGAFSGTGPADPARVLEGFLRALGIEHDTMPPRVEEQAALLRSVAARRRLIILLDNAASAAQVRPLLPGAGGCLVVVTSRRTLPALRVDGARYLELEPLDETGALDLLTAVAGADHAAADPDGARALVAQCGRLPLALTACGAHLGTRPHASVRRLVGRLADERTRLSYLHTLLADDGADDLEDNVNNTGDTGDQAGERSVSAALTTSYDALPSDAARRMYRLLSAHPGPDISVDLAAAVSRVGVPEAERLLEVLSGARLLTENEQGRFGFHDLTRLHARGTSERTDSDIVRRDAFRRIATRLLQVAVAAQKTVNPGRWYLGTYFNEPPVIDFPGPAAALDWLEAERGNLMAVLQHAHEQGDHTSAWELAEAMWGLFTHRKHYHDFQQAHRIGLAAAETTGEARAQARMLEGLASYHNNAGTHAEAADCAQQALALERQTGHLIGEASALDMLGIAHLATGRLTLAGDAFSRARDIHLQLGRPRGAALMTRHLGEVAARAGDHHRAIEHHTEAIGYFASHTHERYLHARALSHRAASHLDLGNLAHAHADLHQAMDLAQQVDAPHEQANIHTALAHLAELRDDPATQDQHLRQALDLYRRLGAPEAGRIAEQLAK